MRYNDATGNSPDGYMHVSGAFRDFIVQELLACQAGVELDEPPFPDRHDYVDSPMPADDDPGWLAYRAACDEIYQRDYSDCGGIPLFKFGYDGWLVTPAEIRAALEKIAPEPLTKPAEEWQIEDWKVFRDFLTEAIEHGGVRCW